MEASATRRCIVAMLAVVSIAAAFTAQKMAQPEPAHAQAILALPLEEGIAYAIFGTTGAAVIYNAVHSSNAPQVARQAARHPARYPALRKWAHQNQSRGQRMWQNAHRKLSGAFHWFRHHYSFQRMKNRAPNAAVACVLSGLFTWSVTGSFDQGRNSCLGAAIVTFGVPGEKMAPSTPGIVARLEAAAR